jgi:hypothetical protein
MLMLYELDGVILTLKPYPTEIAVKSLKSFSSVIRLPEPTTRPAGRNPDRKRSVDPTPTTMMRIIKTMAKVLSGRLALRLPAGVTIEGPAGVPQAGQNFAPSFNSVPHFEQKAIITPQ